MPNMRVYALFRPLNSKEKSDHGDSVSFHGIDPESFVFKDENEEEIKFCFDRVFFEGSDQADIYQFIALPIVEGVIKGMNGAIITYGQTGAGKTYSMQGPNVIECEEKQKGLLPRVVDRLFSTIRLSDYTIKLSMVEIYMERVRDLFDLSKDNLQIKESKQQGIYVYGVTEISISDSEKALQSLSTGIANRAVGATHMNMTSSRSHCIYIFTIHDKLESEKSIRKLILVDLAGSEKAEKTGAEGKALEEAKTINKSLSALGNVIYALSSPGKGNHIPFRDSKLTRILQDALGGNSLTALLCCCSPSPSHASESLSSLRFGARAKHIKEIPHGIPKQEGGGINDPVPVENQSAERIFKKLAEKTKHEEAVLCNPISKEESELAYVDITSQTISSLHQVIEELMAKTDELTKENQLLKRFRIKMLKRLFLSTLFILVLVMITLIL